MSFSRPAAAFALALALSPVGPSSAEAACGPPPLVPVVRPLRPVARLIRAIVRPGRPHPVLRGIRRILVGPVR